MFRLASFFALACVALAASAFLKTSPPPAEQPSEDNDQNDELPNRVAALPRPDSAVYHARFSLN
jgi:hypothetical protein